MGVELDPNWRSVDLKTFAYQPSRIGLGQLVAAFAVAQVELHGTLTPQKVLWAACWWLYLFTHYRDEAGVLSMWDIIAEKFGFMLVWGDLVLVPFFYCAAGWILLEQTEPASWSTIATIAAVYALGLWLFRGANKQKHTFKIDPSAPIWGERPRLTGERLLVSGWWGLGRKINLHRRAHGLLRHRRHRRLHQHRPLPRPALAAVPPRPPRLARRAAPRRQVRPRLGRVPPRRPLPHVPRHLLTGTRARFRHLRACET